MCLYRDYYKAKVHTISVHPKPYRALIVTLKGALKGTLVGHMDP